MVNLQSLSDTSVSRPSQPQGQFVSLGNSKYYQIDTIDRLEPFLVSLISGSNHWGFIFSNGAISAGRIDANHALFPYTTSDKLRDTYQTTGPITIVKVATHNNMKIWQPFKEGIVDSADIQRRMYKSVTGNSVRFEEEHLGHGLTFCYEWSTSNTYGFIRTCSLINNTNEQISVELLDGLQNIMSAGISEDLQVSYSNLVDAYKYNELHSSSLALYTLFSGVTDRAAPMHSFHANVTYSLGTDKDTIYIENDCVRSFIEDTPIVKSSTVRGRRGAYLVRKSLTLMSKESSIWKLIADVHKSQADVVDLEHQLLDKHALADSITASIKNDEAELITMMGRMDALQLTGDELVDTYHFSNTVFNCMRGGVIDNQYSVEIDDFVSSVQNFNKALYAKHQAFFNTLPEELSHQALLILVKGQNCQGLLRLCAEYLPITFGRRHGDPSRPWNKFKIKLTNDEGSKALYYEGNWRDIFQNWEAMLISYPHFINNAIAKFVNNSTIDGHNPYRITKNDIDWETPEEGEWSSIGYWSDHQIIYLLKLLELSVKFDKSALEKLLTQQIYSFANVPYRIKPFDELLKNSKDTIEYDFALDARIAGKVEHIGKDAKLLLDKDDEVVMVNLLEKMCITMLAKISNLVIGGGIWMNTQRPEWNDANNALVGNGISMVTLCYLRRYVAFFKDLVANLSLPNNTFALSTQVSQWLVGTADIIKDAKALVVKGDITAAENYDILNRLGKLASEYRAVVYTQGFSGTTAQSLIILDDLLSNTQAILDYSIRANKTSEGLFHAYNLIHVTNKEVHISNLYTMLEGQVAALSAGAISYDEAIVIIEKLYNTGLYRSDQKTFTLYANKELPSFLEKNCINPTLIERVAGLDAFIDSRQNKIFITDKDDTLRFHADITDEDALLKELAQYPEAVHLKDAILELYRTVFNHNEFTGRSSTMFGYEGLGSIYWHMVSKLIISTQELFFNALREHDSSATKLGELYYRLRCGLSMHKTPLEYGAFPTDPYSHTPAHTGAQQPGMTGQVKEWVLLRFAELGIHVDNGAIYFLPQLLKKSAFCSEKAQYQYTDVDGVSHTLQIEPGQIAFTYCQVPIVYEYTDNVQISIAVTLADQSIEQMVNNMLTHEISQHIFAKTKHISSVRVFIPQSLLFTE